MLSKMNISCYRLSSSIQKCGHHRRLFYDRLKVQDVSIRSILLNPSAYNIYSISPTKNVFSYKTCGTTANTNRQCKRYFNLNYGNNSAQKHNEKNEQTKENKPNLNVGTIGHDLTNHFWQSLR